MPNLSISGRYKSVLLTACGILFAIVSFLAWRHYFPVTVAAGWAWQVYLDDVRMVSALARDESGTLYITQEYDKRRGLLLKQLPDGSLEEVASGLDKPDGLASFRDGILVREALNKV
jgi:hypothetical protein